MGKHTQRKPGHLAKAAPGAKPPALLLTDHTTTTHPLPGLPLDLRLADPAGSVSPATASRALPPSALGQRGGGAAGNSLTPVKSVSGFVPSHGVLRGPAMPPALTPPHESHPAPGFGHFTGDLHGGVGTHRSPSHSATPPATTSHHSTGQFTGSLDAPGSPPAPPRCPRRRAADARPANAFHGDPPFGATASALPRSGQPVVGAPVELV